jgi:hypothetical protein
VIGASEPDPSWFNGNEFLSPRAQIQVYRTQYEIRLLEAIEEEVPGYVALAGDAGPAALRAYLTSTPSRHWTLNRVADAFADWLEQHDAPVAHVEMARLDRIVMAGFEAAWGTPLEAARLQQLPALVLQPHVGLLRATHSVHTYRSEVLADKSPPALEVGDFPVVVYRAHIRMRHLVIPAGAFTVLATLRDGGTVLEALERLVAEGMDPGSIGPVIQQWFAMFAEHQLVQVA